VRPSGWQPFGSLFGPTYRAITRSITPRKPLMIAETASTELGGSKAQWIDEMLRRELPRRFPKVRALIYFNRLAEDVDWRLESSPAATAAFASAIGASYFSQGRFGAIRGSPIRPPRP
jgi:hypothetical protein